VEKMVLTNYLTPTYQQQFLLPSLLLQINSQSRVAILSNNNLLAIFHNHFKEMRLWQYQAAVVMQRREVTHI